jgi:hypothetical protein
MSVSRRLSVISRLAGAVAVICMSGIGSAWAGDGSSGMSVYGLFLTICSFFPQITTCPVFPTESTADPLTPIILEWAALTNNPPDQVRVDNTLCIPTGPVSGLPFCSQIAINAANQPATSLPEDFTDALAQLTPLAFISNQRTLSVTQYGDPAANSFLYAYVAASQGGGLPFAATQGSRQPDTAVFIFDYLPGTANKISVGQPAASVTFQTAVKMHPSDTTERSVTTRLLLTPFCNGFAACLSGTIFGDFVTPGTVKAYTPAQLGMQFSVAFGSSPNSPKPHTMLQLLAPLLVTPTTDPAYFEGSPCPTGINPVSGYCVAFSSPELGFTPKFLGMPIGISPLAALGPAPATPAGAPPGPPIVASFFGNPAVSTFFAIGTNGVTLVSTQVSSSSD